MEEELVSILEQVSFIKLEVHISPTVQREIFGNENGRGSTEKKAVNKDFTPRMSTMERLQASMKACVAPPPDDDPPFPLDPLLLTESSTTACASAP